MIRKTNEKIVKIQESILHSPILERAESRENTVWVYHNRHQNFTAEFGEFWPTFTYCRSSMIVITHFISRESRVRKTIHILNQETFSKEAPDLQLLLSLFKQLF